MVVADDIGKFCTSLRVTYPCLIYTGNMLDTGPNIGQTAFHLEKVDGIEKIWDRYIGYSLLKNVEYNGEPVVPRILEEGSEPDNVYLKTELLPGIELGEFIAKPDVTLKRKFEVFLHIASQFQAIDKAGFELFDRNHKNVRILDWGDKISVRQVDIPDLYDKTSESFYSSVWKSDYDDYLKRLTEQGLSVWTPEIDRLQELETEVLRKSRRKDLLDLVSDPDGLQNNTPDVLEAHVRKLKNLVEVLS